MRAAVFLAHHQKAVSRTDRLIPLIPAPAADWRPAPGAFSFSELLRHVGGIERWMWAENAHGRPARYPGHGADLAAGWPQTLEYVAQCRAESRALFAQLSDADLMRRVTTPAGVQLVLWKWLRAMLEHEAHHRGQLYLMLRMMGVETPPLFGLTSEQVREARQP